MANSKSTDKKKQTAKAANGKQPASESVKKTTAKTKTATQSASAKKSTASAPKAVPEKKTAAKSASVSGKSNQKKAPAASKSKTQPAANSEPVVESTQRGVKAYHISFRPEENRWQVKLGKGSRALKLFNTQEEAIDFAREMAKNQEGHIVIHKLDGKMRKQRY